jgi:hypothetical protein
MKKKRAKEGKGKGNKPVIEEMEHAEQDMFFVIPPVKTYKIKVKIKSIKKGEIKWIP